MASMLGAETFEALSRAMLGVFLYGENAGWHTDFQQGCCQGVLDFHGC